LGRSSASIVNTMSLPHIVFGLTDARRNSPNGDRLDVLVTLVEAWERKHYPLDLADPVEAIRLRAAAARPHPLYREPESRARSAESSA
jgi:hypothetical protein